MKINFRSYDKPEYYNVTQIIAVRPGTAYRLSFYVRTEDLASAGLPLVQIWNIGENGLIASSSPFAAGSNDWQQVTIDFISPETAQGIMIRTARNFCGEGCPIVGILWYDDFQLQRL